MQRVVFSLVLLMLLLSGCVPFSGSKSTLYLAKYTEVVENGRLVDSKLIMLPQWENDVESFERVKTTARSKVHPDLSVGVTLWHNAVTNVLVAKGKKSIHGMTQSNRRAIADSITIDYQGYVLSPPTYADTGQDTFTGEAYGTFEFDFSALP